MSVKRIILCCAVFLLCTGTYASDPPRPPLWPPPFPIAIQPLTVDAESARLAHDLSSEDFPTRERASKELAERGPGAFPTLREAVVASKDPEAISRIARVYPNTMAFPPNLPAHTIDELVLYLRKKAGDRDARGFGFESGDLWYEHGDLFFRVIRSQEKEPEQLKALFQFMDQRVPTNARLAIASGELEAAESLLRSKLPYNCDDYVALRALRQGSAFDPEKELEALDHFYFSRDQLAPIAMKLCLAKGDLRRAAAYAPYAVAGEWRSSFSDAGSLLIEADNYAALAQLGRTHPKTGTFDKYNLPEVLAMRLSGQAPEANLALDTISRKVTADPDYRGDWIWLLIQNDRIQECIDQLKAHKDNSDAFLLLASQLRLREAMALPLENAAEPARLLARMGFPKQAANMLRKYPPQPSRSYPEIQLCMQYVQAFRSLGLEQDAIEYEDKVWNLEAQKPQTADLQYLLQDYWQYREAKFWAGGNAEYVGRSRFENARQIVLDQKKPTLTPDFVENTLATMSDRWTSFDSIRVPFNALVRTGNTDTAQKLILTWCQRSRDPTALSLLGDLALENDKPAVAADYYLKAAAINRTDASLMYRVGIALSRQPQTGDQGAQMMTYAPLLALADGDQLRRLEIAIRRFEGPAKADRWMLNYSGRIGRPDAFIRDRLKIARESAEAKGDFSQALKLQTQALFRPSSLSPIGYTNGLAHLALYHRLRALEAVTRKDTATIAEALNRHLDAAAPDADLLERTIPLLRISDPASAKAILTRSVDRLSSVVQDYPDASKYADDLRRIRALQN